MNLIKRKCFPLEKLPVPYSPKITIRSSTVFTRIYIKRTFLASKMSVKGRVRTTQGYENWRTSMKFTCRFHAQSLGMRKDFRTAPLHNLWYALHEDKNGSYPLLLNIRICILGVFRTTICE